MSSLIYCDDILRPRRAQPVKIPIGSLQFLSLKRSRALFISATPLGKCLAADHHEAQKLISF